MKRLYRSKTDRKVCGVCGGIAEYLDIDPTIIRLICLILCCCTGFGIFIYFLASFVIPYKPETEEE